MRLDLRSAVSTQAAHGVTVQQTTEKISCSRRDNVAAGEGQRLLQDLAIHFVGVFIIEWRQACQHLVEQDTESPPIHGLGVAVAEEKFRSEIFGSSTERLGLVSYVGLIMSEEILLLVRSSSFISSLQRPKSQRAICPV